jgi:hypothetical protein
VISPKGVRLCRPSEAVLDLLPAQQGELKTRVTRKMASASMGTFLVLVGDDAQAEAMRRPWPKGVRLCRPSEAVLDLLPAQQGEFVTEDGERVVDEQSPAAG